MEERTDQSAEEFEAETERVEASINSAFSDKHKEFVNSIAKIEHGVIYDTRGVVIGRTVAATSIVYLHGEAVELMTDCAIAFAGMESEQKFAGLLVGNPTNFTANKDQLQHRYNPLNAARMANECEVCGRDIPFAAADQRTCGAVCADALREKETGSALTEESSAIVAAGPISADNAESALTADGGAIADPKAHLRSEPIPPTEAEKAAGLTSVGPVDDQNTALREEPATIFDPQTFTESPHPVNAPVPSFAEQKAAQAQSENDPRIESERPQPDPEIEH